MALCLCAGAAGGGGQARARGAAARGQQRRRGHDGAAAAEAPAQRTQRTVGAAGGAQPLPLRGRLPLAADGCLLTHPVSHLDSL